MKMNQEDTSISPFDPLGHPVFLVLDHKPAFKPFSWRLWIVIVWGSTPSNTSNTGS